MDERISYSKNYYNQSSLLVKVLPYLNEVPCFALKGGTAINFFYQNMPRLSVDIDLAYLPSKHREQAIPEIKSTILHLAKYIQNEHPEMKVMWDKTPHILIPKLQIQEKNAIVKIEVNSVFRGTVFPTEEKSLCEAAQTLFESEFKIKTLSLGDLYAGKLCAALNRQHPRDLFDVKLLMSSHGITKEIQQAFIVYLSGDKRPIHELLIPTLKNNVLQESVHKNELSGMTKENINYHDLSGVLSTFLKQIKQKITTHEKEFLLSLCAGEPKWELMPFNHLKDLPALQWKLLNVQTMEAGKRQQSLQELASIFNAPLKKSAQTEIKGLDKILIQYLEKEIERARLVTQKIIHLGKNPELAKSCAEQSQAIRQEIIAFASAAIKNPVIAAELEAVKSIRISTTSDKDRLENIQKRLNKTNSLSEKDKAILVSRLKSSATSVQKAQQLNQKIDQGGRKY